MRDTPPPTADSSDAGNAEERIQRRWDRFAMPDHSVDPESDDASLIFSPRTWTDGTFVTGPSDSFPVYDTTTGLDEIFASTKAIDVAVEDASTPDDSEASS